MTYGAGAGMRIGGGTRRKTRLWRCTFPYPEPGGCQAVLRSERTTPPECPTESRHGPMVPADSGK